MEVEIDENFESNYKGLYVIVIMKQRKITVKRILAALLGVFFVGIGVAFNNCAGLGNDPIGMLYDGIRTAGNMSPEQLGIASNIVNISLVIVLFFVGRHYINIGTLIYFLPYGFFVNIGTHLYEIMNLSEGFAGRIFFSAAGCFMLCLGVAIYITVDIGVDPFTGIVLRICDTVHKEYRVVKVVFDIFMTVIGVFLGGKIGVVTVVTAFVVGPTIQFLSKKIMIYSARISKRFDSC